MTRSNISNCRSCDAPIVWMVTKRNKNIPVDLDSVTNDDDLAEAESGGKVLFEYGQHVCHFETCPNAKEHRQ